MGKIVFEVSHVMLYLFFLVVEILCLFLFWHGLLDALEENLADLFKFSHL
jgi:hypothetical protein